MQSKKPTHFAVEDITFYGMDEDNEIITNDKGEAVVYQLKAGVRFKPLEYLCEDMMAEQLERNQSKRFGYLKGFFLGRNMIFI